MSSEQQFTISDQTDGNQSQTVCTYVSVRESVEAVVHRQHGVSLNHADPDGRAHRRVHAGAWRTDVHHGHVDVALGIRETEEEQV